MNYNLNKIDIITKPEKNKAVRVFLVRENKVAVIHVNKFQYFKLPGGGVENGEKLNEALIRETREETGCEIYKVKKLFDITVYAKEINVVQISKYYFAEVNGERNTPDFTEKEIANGLSLEWVSISDLNKLINSSKKQQENINNLVIKRDILATKLFLKINTQKTMKK